MAYEQIIVKQLYFQETKPASIRLWHWLTFLFFTVSVTTVIFASTLFKSRSNIAMVQEQVQQKGGVVTKEQAMSVAHEYSDKLWMLHKYIGYGLCILLFFRIVTEIILSKESGLGTRIKKSDELPRKWRKNTLFICRIWLCSFLYIVYNHGSNRISACI